MYDFIRKLFDGCKRIGRKLFLCKCKSGGSSPDAYAALRMKRNDIQLKRMQMLPFFWKHDKNKVVVST